MAAHSSILAWRIPWTEENGRLQAIGLHRLGHYWSVLACTHVRNVRVWSSVRLLLQSSVLRKPLWSLVWLESSTAVTSAFSWDTGNGQDTPFSSDLLYLCVLRGEDEDGAGLRLTCDLTSVLTLLSSLLVIPFSRWGSKEKERMHDELLQAVSKVCWDLLIVFCLLKVNAW